MFSSIVQNPMVTLATTLSVLLVSTTALDLVLCYDREFREGCAVRRSILTKQLVSSSFSSSGCFWDMGFDAYFHSQNTGCRSTAAIVTVAVTAGVVVRTMPCRASSSPVDAAASIKMQTAWAQQCSERCNIEVPSISDKYGKYNDVLSSVYCELS
jgi:hypothetical protein